MYVYVYKSVCVQTGTHMAGTAGYLCRCLVGTSSTRFDQAGSNSLRFSCFRSVIVAYTDEDGVCERTNLAPKFGWGPGGIPRNFGISTSKLLWGSLGCYIIYNIYNSYYYNYAIYI